MSPNGLAGLVGKSVTVVLFAFATARTGGVYGAEECGTPIEPDPMPDPATFVPVPAVCFGGGAPGPNDCTDDGCVIDVLVVYSPAARIAAGGTAGIENIIVEAEIAANQAMAGSDVNVHVRVVAMAEVGYDESSQTTLDSALNCLRDPLCMPEAHALREEVQADAVSLFLDDLHEGAGLAIILGE